ncbi:probable type I site-specific deoxyribonuclease, HsdR family [Mycoplasma suis KI3806]|uniref:type I site-specific deoxyribonuclease n=1 Tax=Mycoplasma suis (strain KI_3806) TaxID=708248 RepID=F0V2W2_MYCS3|nr:type I restriction endonuclease [Mycoplasma suis]CBZ40184.1 probable type I site-specific deoxyribonuclease, HsdR family [Mycoplasma suis KI3806]
MIKKNILNIFQKQLSWKIENFSEIYANGSLKGSIFDREFNSSLKKINSEISSSEIEEVKELLKKDISKEFDLRVNKSKYLLIRDGIQIISKKDEKKKVIKLIDFENPENNLFTLVSDFSLKNKDSKTSNFVGFANGIPLLFIFLVSESLNSFEEKFIKSYKENLKDSPDLFSYNSFCILTNGNESKIGTIGEEFSSYRNWTRLREEEKSNNNIEIFLQGTCNKNNFLDLLENFIIFPKEKGKLKKIMVQNHQFLGVNLAFESYINKEKNKGKLGIFYHTRGSGKKYSILFLAEKIKRKAKESPSFLFISDREFLEEELYELFIDCNVLKKDKDYLVNRKEELKGKLLSKKSYLFCLIHKFYGVSLPEINNKNTLIIVNEACRIFDNSKFEGLVKVFPNSARIGFSSTPLVRGDTKVVRYFGEYISIYELGKAIVDGIALPLAYENRACKIKLLEKSSIKEDFFEMTKEKLPEEYLKIEHLLMVEDRLRRNAQDFVHFFSNNLKQGKGIYICFNSKACLLMRHFIREYWNEEIKKLTKTLQQFVGNEKRKKIEEQIKLMKKFEMEIISNTYGLKAKNIYDYYGIKVEIPKVISSEKLLKKFKSKKDNLKVVFTTSTWPSGFDIKELNFVFIDKPFLNERELMQVVSLPTSKDEGKEEGVIIDYFDNCSGIRGAISNLYSSKRISFGDISLTPQIIGKINTYIRGIENIFSYLSISLKKFESEEKVNKRREMLLEYKKKLLSDIESKEAFNDYYEQLSNIFKSFFSHELTEEIRNKFSFFKIIYNFLNRKDYLMSEKDDLESDLFKLLNKYIKVER